MPTTTTLGNEETRNYFVPIVLSFILEPNYDRDTHWVGAADRPKLDCYINFLKGISFETWTFLRTGPAKWFRANTDKCYF